ncbi:hypothetical protein H5V45_10210 [Nocardioides sp. KIGAM211]|uniref:Alpha/beta hydrolase n=1 Tax=Nocardioides luti TaxID=2761101 RepID=A0A7X0RG48_9ACTN|nr:hypothetical protein [Nocardioides luti]MBB6627693.1 hypothetical protein [Nocardioides luti]
MSTEPHPVPITGVTGGSEGVEATYDAVLALAATYDTAGNQMRDWAGRGGRTLTNGDLVESAILSPISFAEAEASVIAATTGPDGVLVESLGWETDAILIRVVVRVFRETDDLAHGTFEVVDYLVGRMIGFTLVVSAPALLATALTAGPVAYVVWQHLPPALQQQLERDAAGAGAALEDWLAEHPEVLQHLINGGGGLLDGLWDGTTPLVPGGPFGLPSFTPDTESAAGLLAALFGPDGDPVVSTTDLTTPSGGTQPGSLADVVTHLGETNDLDNGTIEIQTIDDGQGHVRHIVYLPGTDDLTTMPWTQDGDVRDMATNYLLISGQDNAYLEGIRLAMQEAGIQPDDPVLLAGHSQGGMEAAALLSNDSGFHVTNVVTAGAPTAQVDGFPPGTHVLSLENQGDVVPLLDGEENPDSPQQVTVHFDDQGSSIGDSHGLDHYANGAAAVDASTDPSIVEQLQSLQDNGYLGAGDGSVSSQVFEITRGP